MAAVKDNKLFQLIRYGPVIFFGVFALAINFIVIKENSDRAEHSIDTLRSEVVRRQKEIIKQHVDQITNEIGYHQSRAENVLKTQAKNRVEEAYQIAINLHQTNLDKSKQQISKIISEALRPIRFFDGRGYFFVFNMDGTNVMHGLRPHVEGKNLIDSEDVRGTKILKEHINLVSQSGEAYYRWWYPKPNYPETMEFEKIGFAKLFEPYNWLIGTGEYLADVEHDIQKQVLDWINNYSFDNRGYIFVVDNNGVILSHREPSYVGINLKDFKDPAGLQMRGMILNSDADGGFVRYDIPTVPESDKKEEKISYIQKVEKWGWYIGTGFYLKDFEVYFSKQRGLLEEKNRAELTKITILSVLLTGILMALSMLLSNNLARRFERFQSRIDDDFCELEVTRDRMQHMALHDALTGLPNRLLLLDNINQGIDISRKSGSYLAVIFVDLDDFKKVNDLYGHSSGDKLLEIISRKFETLLGDNDTVSRFGGDEFIFCFPMLDDISQAEKRVSKIKDVFRDQFVINGKILSSNCSVGISMYPNDSDDAESLIRKADIVLYRAKSIRKGDVMFYDNKINQQVQLDFLLEEELRRALRKGELSVLYQPQINVKKQKLVSVEALARWNNDRMGCVSPSKFIAIAEDMGLINEIGLFVFRTACEDILSYSPNSSHAIKVSINISPKQLMRETFAEELLTITNDVGIDVERINLEITENVLINDMDKVAPVLNMLRNLGFGISLDDFGTGYSSLSYLNSLPITEIKIDRCFVDKLLVSEQSNTLVKAIIAIGESCGMQVVAEGVETKKQYQQLMSYGCNLVQGYYFDRPLPIDKLMSRTEGQESA